MIFGIPAPARWHGEGRRCRRSEGFWATSPTTTQRYSHLVATDLVDLIERTD